MRIHRRIKNLTDPEKEQFEDYLEQKLKKLTSIVQAHHPDEDTTALNVGIEKIKQFNRVVFKFSYKLDLPRTRPLAARGAKHTVTECMDEATSKLEGSLRKAFSGIKERKRKKQAA